MSLWWILFVCGLIIPTIMIVCGTFMWKRPPKKVNGIIGYRSARSMKNADTWKFAHSFCGKLWLITGLVIFTVSVAVPCPFYDAADKTAGTVSGILIAVQLAAILASVIPTEIALKKRFTDDGLPK